MSELTPGPWKLGETGSHPGDVAKSYGEATQFGDSWPIEGGGRLVAIAIDHDLGTEETFDYCADARLIAAAPDLLAACKAVTHWLATAPIGGSFDRPWNPKALKTAAEKALAAAVKAEYGR